MIVEMRTYKLKPGLRARFLEIFRSKSVPKHLELGMRILGPFLSVEDPETFFFMRGFPDLRSRAPMKAQFYDGDLWKRELENVLMPMIDKYEVVVVDDPENLIRWQHLQGDVRRRVEYETSGESLMPPTLYMVIEHFKGGDPAPVYRRFRDRGRMAPEGLNYISSWIDHNLTTCLQVMETADRALLDQWMARWEDVVDFEVYPVMTSKEAVERVNRPL